MQNKTEFDYDNQAWIVDGKYIRCGHHEEHDCMCYGKKWEGLTVEQARRAELQFIQEAK